MLISDRWKVLIIRDLLDGIKRFGEIKKSVGNISQKVLTANLRSMESSGLLMGISHKVEKRISADYCINRYILRTYNVS